MKRAVWVCFDLGVSGDYPGMYAWLDSAGARECGDNVAFVEYEAASDLLAELKRDLQEAVEIGKKSRVYVIYRSDEGKVTGAFLFGSRRQAPWTGYGAAKEQESVDEA